MVTSNSMILKSESELEEFRKIQSKFPEQYKSVFTDPNAPRTVIVVPSLTLDSEQLASITGAHHYEERMLCLLMLLKLPRTHVIFLSSQPIAPAIIDYYLHLLPGIPINHARQRLTLLCCYDSSPLCLTQKILDRPRLIKRVKDCLHPLKYVHMTCFNTTQLERTLAVRLGVPLYGCDPDIMWLGSKSGNRKVFKEAGLDIPDGFEDIYDVKDIVGALTSLKKHNTKLKRAVIKLNEGFSGKGNAIVPFENSPKSKELEKWIATELSKIIRFEAKDESWESYSTKIAEMGAIVECFIEGKEKRSPSVQCRINPLGEIEPISTHDQILGGPSGQVFLGSTFPADKSYRLEIQQACIKVAKVLRDYGAISRFGVDFISVREGDTWKNYAIEINLRKGGTTHSYMMLQYLADGNYDINTGLYLAAGKQACYYQASDNIESNAYKGLIPEDLIDISVLHDLHFHSAIQQGVVFHLIGALSEFGKIGMLCVADSQERAAQLYHDTVSILDQETA